MINIINDTQCKVKKLNQCINKICNNPLFKIQTDDGTIISITLNVNKNDLVLFKTDGGVELLGEEGSAIVNINPNNIFINSIPPSDPPNDSSRPALAINSTDDKIFYWNPDSQSWIVVIFLNNNIGSTGNNGLTGNIGLTGNTGLQGEIGNQGATGLTGNTGNTGLQGEIGNPGFTGVLNDLTDVCIEGATAGDIILFGATCWGNTALCINTLCDAGTSGTNISFGTDTLQSLTTGTDNIAIGNDVTAENLTTGSRNIVAGNIALQFNLGGNDNTEIGYHIYAGSALGSASNLTNIRSTLSVSFAATPGDNNTSIGFITNMPSITQVANTSLGSNLWQD